jgi:hypothetical protein
MAIGASLIADKGCSLNHRRRNDGPLNRRTGNYQQNECAKAGKESNPKNDTLDFRPWQTHAHKLRIGIYQSLLLRIW